MRDIRLGREEVVGAGVVVEVGRVRVVTEGGFGGVVGVGSEVGVGVGWAVVGVGMVDVGVGGTGFGRVEASVGEGGEASVSISICRWNAGFSPFVDEDLVSEWRLNLSCCRSKWRKSTSVWWHTESQHNWRSGRRGTSGVSVTLGPFPGTMRSWICCSSSDLRF